MNRYVSVSACCVALCLFLSIPPAGAAVFERDWKTPGDGLLTYDDVNQREWLDLSETLLIKFPGPFEGSIPQMYQNVVAETAPGGLFAGFTVASESDVIHLAESAGIDTSTSLLAINFTATNDLIDLVGPTVEIGGSREALGFLTHFPASVFLQVAPQIDLAGLSTGSFTSDPSQIPSITGLWLHRQLIPEPSAWLLLTAGFGFLSARMRWLRRR